MQTRLTPDLQQTCFGLSNTGITVCHHGQSQVGADQLSTEMVDVVNLTASQIAWEMGPSNTHQGLP